MRKILCVTLLVGFTLLPAAAARADHIPPQLGIIPGSLPAPLTFLQQGPIRYVGNVQTGRAVSGPLGEVGPFERDGRRYIVTGSSYYGFSVVDVTDPLAPTTVSEYASAFGCPTSVPEQVAARRIDVLGYGGWENDVSFAPDGRWVAMGMDANGRCHDPLSGGVEIVDLSDVKNPHLLHLVRNIGYSHSITLDPLHPWLAYISTSDSNDVLDIIDFHTCIGKPPASCKTTVARAVFDPEYMPGLADPKTRDDLTTSGCHDIRFRGDRAYCAAIGSTLILDVSHVLGPDGQLTGSHLTDGNACPNIPADPIYAPNARITDCLGWTKDAFKKAHGKAVDIRLVSVIKHDGTKPSDQDIQIAHQADVIGDGKILFITDERGGGLGTDQCPGGGVWFYDVRDERHPVLMRQPDGSNGVFLTKYNIPSIAGMNPSCTVHYGREYADENLMTFGWYTNGTRVFRYYPDFTVSPAQIRFEEVAAIAPVGWAFDSMAIGRNPQNPGEILVYTSDFTRGIDVFAVATPHIARSTAFKGAGSPTTPGAPNPKPKPKPNPGVGGAKNPKPLPGTGVGDPTGFGLLLLALALRAVVRRTGLSTGD